MRKELILIALVPLAVGCGAKESAADGSAGATEDAGSSRIEMTMSAPDDGLPYSATGAIDYARDRGEIVITSPSDTLEFPGGEMHDRFVGRTIYIGLTLQGELRWTKEVDDLRGTDRFIPGPGGPGPERLLDLLVKSSKKVENLGTDDIRGVPAKHYRAHLDTKKLGGEFTHYGNNVVIDAWIDEDGLVRRVRVPDGGEGSGFTVADYFDYGVDVDVEAPPAEEIISDREFFKLVEKECRVTPSEKGLRNNEFCASISGGESSLEGPTKTMPRTITEPSK
jgi:hypothetical protein